MAHAPAAAASELERNKAVVLRYKTQLLNARDLDSLADVAAADYLDHAAFPGQLPGRRGLAQRLSSIIDALDPHWTVDDIVGEDDIVAIRWHLDGFHTGTFLGVPPTGRPCTVHGIDVYRVRGGLICEHWNVIDMLGFVEQATPSQEAGSYA
ncbi:MAG: ester cyclase [Candidatus Dormibacteria bacterium]